ncbi:unnamed protein product [Umbelopsis ramanniana]
MKYPSFLKGFIGLFTFGMCGLSIYFLYILSKDIDGALYHAGTNCTILDKWVDSDNFVYIHVNYTLPGNDFNTTSFLQRATIGDNFQVGEIIPCFYSLHDHSYIMAHVDISAVIAFGFIFAILMCIPAAVVAYILLNVIVSFISSHLVPTMTMHPKALSDDVVTQLGPIYKGNPEDKQDNRKSTVSWLRALFTWNRSRRARPQDMYALEDQNSFISEVGSDHSVGSTKELLSQPKKST